MLRLYAIGVWVFSLISDFIFYGTGNLVWLNVAFYCMAAGIIGALVAAIPGLIDYQVIEEPLLRRIATTHMVMNFSIVALYAVNLWLRTFMPAEAVLPVVLSVVSVLALCVSGWLGGEMVYLHGMAVDTRARPTQQLPKITPMPGPMHGEEGERRAA